MTNEAPVPTEETTVRSPPCARAISRLAASPSPAPAFVVVNGSNKCLRMDGSIPLPVSVTLATAHAPSRSSRTVTVPPAGQRLLRVDQQAQEDLTQPGGAAVDVERLAAMLLSQLDVLVRVRAADELDGLLADPVQRDGPGVVGLGTGVPEQRIHDVPDLEPALPDEEQPVVLGRSRLEVGEENVDEAEDPEERVVDLVREPPDELSEQAEPTRLEEGFSFGSELDPRRKTAKRLRRVASA